MVLETVVVVDNHLATHIPPINPCTFSNVPGKHSYNSNIVLLGPFCVNAIDILLSHFKIFGVTPLLESWGSGSVFFCAFCVEDTHIQLWNE